MADPEQTLLDELEAQKQSGEEYQIQEALVDLANFYRDRKSWAKLRSISEERHARYMNQKTANPVLIYLAHTFVDEGMVDDAINLLSQVKEDYERINAQLTADYYSALLSVHTMQEDFQAAVEVCRKVVALAKAHPEYSDYWEMQAHLADLIQYRLQDLPACLPERHVLWTHFRSKLDDDVELSYNAAMVHVANGASYAAALSEVDPQRAPPIYATLIHDVETSRWFGPDRAEVATLREAKKACEVKLN